MQKSVIKPLKILFIGDLNTYGRGYQRYQTLVRLGHKVEALSHTPVSEVGKIDPPSLSLRVSTKIGFPLDVTGVNEKMIVYASKFDFDLIWIEKGNSITPSTLKRLRENSTRTKIISFSEDDMYVRHGHSKWYCMGLRWYDCVFTTKEYNVKELYEFKAKRTRLVLDSYDEYMHLPMRLSNEDSKRFRSDVSAIGAYEPERANSMLYLASNGVKINVWGNGWSSWLGRHPNLKVKNQFLFGKDYAKAINASKINLNFLRKINRDEVTSRSVEIPACGGFMLAERTVRHKKFFTEGAEAEFFDSNEELLEKTRFYLKNENERNSIAFAGRERCLKSGYSTAEQLRNVLEYLETLSFTNSKF